MNGDIVIKKHPSHGFIVEYDGKIADRLCYDEMLGLISAITIPDDKPCLNWLKTPQQIENWNNMLKK